MEIIYGRNAVSEALKSTKPGAKVTRLYLAEGVETKSGPVEAILKLAASRDKKGIPVQKTPRQELDRLTNGANHQGIAAEVPPYSYTRFEDLVKIANDDPNALFLVLDYLQDPQNLGTLLRS